MSIISINIRGLGGNVKWNYIKELVRKENPIVICIQETKLAKLIDLKCYSLWGSNDIS